jgi:hypothetical protein
VPASVESKQPARSTHSSAEHVTSGCSGGTRMPYTTHLSGACWCRRGSRVLCVAVLSAPFATSWHSGDGSTARRQDQTCHLCRCQGRGAKVRCAYWYEDAYAEVVTTTVQRLLEAACILKPSLYQLPLSGTKMTGLNDFP